MRRKLIKQGIDTYTLSLPVKWIRKNNLKASEEVDIGEEGSNLMVTFSKFVSLRML